VQLHPCNCADARGHLVLHVDCEHGCDDCGIGKEIRPVVSSGGAGGRFVLLWLEQAPSLADATSAGRERGGPESAQRLQQPIFFSARNIYDHRNRHVRIAVAFHIILAHGELTHIVENAKQPGQSG
jgi:hypothetical protein